MQIIHQELFQEVGRTGGIVPFPYFQLERAELHEYFPTICSACLDMIYERYCTEARSIFERLPELLGISVASWPGQDARDSAPD